MESTRILSNFYFQWTNPYTRILYKILHSFSHFSKAKDVISYL